MATIPYEIRLEDIRANVVDIADFNERVIGAYNSGLAERGLPADDQTARSVVPAARGRSAISAISLPTSRSSSPKTASGAWNASRSVRTRRFWARWWSPRRSMSTSHGSPTKPSARIWPRSGATRTSTTPCLRRRAWAAASSASSSIRRKCKGCAECVDACGDHDALKMIRKNDQNMKWYRTAFEMYKSVPETPAKFINEKALADMMLAERSLLYVGGAGSCMGCGEATALRMMLAATGFLYGEENVGIVAATGCNTVYTSTYPYNPYHVSWTNSLFENAPADAMGVRARWDQMGWQQQAPLDRRRRRRDERHRLPVALAHAGVGHRHQGDRPRYAGLLEHRRAGVHQFLQGSGRQDELPRQGPFPERKRIERKWRTSA